MASAWHSSDPAVRQGDAWAPAPGGDRLDRLLDPRRLALVPPARRGRGGPRARWHPGARLGRLFHGRRPAPARQVLAQGTEVGLGIVRRLLMVKLEGHTAVARDVLDDTRGAEIVEGFAEAMALAEDVEDALSPRSSGGGRLLRGCWPQVDAVRFVAKDAPRVPPHWRRFNGRRSGSRARQLEPARERPLNALLNYCYRLAEAEARLALLVVGLDPGLGLLHADYPGRDAVGTRPHGTDTPSRRALCASCSARASLPQAGLHRDTRWPRGRWRLSPTSWPRPCLRGRAVAPHAEAIVHVSRRAGARADREANAAHLGPSQSGPPGVAPEPQAPGESAGYLGWAAQGVVLRSNDPATRGVRPAYQRPAARDREKA